MSCCNNCNGCSTEYNNGASKPNAGASNYGVLGMYNSPPAGTVVGPPVEPGTPSMAVETVPQYNLPLRYNALTHGLPAELSNGCHFTINNAYPATPSARRRSHCDTFQKRSCSGNVQPLYPAHTVVPTHLRPTPYPAHGYVTNSPVPTHLRTPYPAHGYVTNSPVPTNVVGY